MNEWLKQLRPKHVLFILLALCLAVFAQTATFGFIALDDSKHIWTNPYVSNLSSSTLSFFWKQPYYGLFIPVAYNAWTVLSSVSQSLFAAHDVTKFSAAPFHVFNTLLHTLSCFVVFQILQLLLDWKSSRSSKEDSETFWLAALATLPFAIHPLQAEAVAWASGLKDVLMTFFMLLACVLYLRLIVRSELKSLSYKKSKKKSKDSDKAFRSGDLKQRLHPLWHKNISGLQDIVVTGLIIALFFLAMLTKPAAIVLLGFIFLVHWFLFPKSWQTKMPMIFLMLLGAGYLIWWTKQLQPSARLEFDPTPLLRATTAIASLGFYTLKSVLPFGLSPDYGLTPPLIAKTSLFPAYLLCGAGIITLSAWGLYKKTLQGLAAGLMIVGVAPVLGIIPFEYQNISTVADRYTYSFFMIGFGLLLTSSQRWLSRKQMRQAFVALASVWLIFSFLQVSHWRDNNALFSQVLNVNPKSHLAYNNLGIYAMRSGDFKKAEENLLKAMQMKEKYLAAQSNLGVVYFKQKDFPKVIKYYTEILGDYPEKHAGDPATFADMHFNLGAALVNTGKLNESVYHLTKATEINVLHFKAHLQLGRVLAHLGRKDEGRRSLLNAYKLNPKNKLVVTELKKLGPPTKN